uniref:Uncharacterized protein n=1 Tax=Anopheles stephensi TaxID=30069 RepID=A0A182XV70_ANOST
MHYLPGVHSVCVDKLSHLVDEFTRFVNGLVKLKEPVDSWDTPLSNMLLMKLDRETLLAWEKHSVHFTRDKYKDVIEFVQDRIQILKSTNTFVMDQSAGGTKVAGNSRQPVQRRFIAYFSPGSCSFVCPHPTAKVSTGVFRRSHFAQLPSVHR